MSAPIFNLPDSSTQAFIAGVDEAGRGPLCGDVVAAAVVLDPCNPIAGLADSKKLSEKKREQLFVEIQEKALAWSIAAATPAEIDELNILQATMLAMRRAVLGLATCGPAGFDLSRIDLVQVDGNRCPDIGLPVEAVVKGDSKVQAISAASILAKVTRDRQCLLMDEAFPGYGIAAHKGYPTAEHLDALRRLGPTPFHRKSYGPVSAVLGAALDTHHVKKDMFTQPLF